MVSGGGPTHAEKRIAELVAAARRPGEQVDYVRPRIDDAGHCQAVVLDRVDDVAADATDYCVHGRTMCYLCQAWCWLGDRTKALVESGTVPLCHACATTKAGRGAPAGNVQDHRRADGPH